MRLDDGASDDVFDYDLGVLMVNLQADFWDISAQYDQMLGQVKDPATPSPAKPSCSVLIKHLKDKDNILVAHNTWHEYRAMAYK